MALIPQRSLQASDLDESSKPPSGRTRPILDPHKDPYDATWIKSTSDLNIWFSSRVDDWRALVAPYAFPDLDNSNICARCKAFDLDTFFDQAEGTSDSLEFTPDMSQMDAGCAFCTFLTAVSGDPDGEFWVANPSTGDIGWFYLSTPLGSSSSSPSFRLVMQWLEPHALSLSSTAWPPTPTAANFAALKQNLTHCIASHANICGAGEATPVDGLRVLNCATRHVEPAVADTRYVALSYVWGGATPTGETLLKTIADAATATRALGYTHLWVDQLCIDQADPNKLVQIRQMDRIYRNADATIIAAAGAHADHGIPGAGSPPAAFAFAPAGVAGGCCARQPQRCAHTGRHVLVEKKRPLSRNLDGTTWNTRGWTYQEKLLSRRCVVFTAQEAWFTCACTPADEGCETVPAEVREMVQGQEKQQELPPVPSLPLTMRAGEADLAYIISEYSERTLTVPADVINAFEGILKVFEQTAAAAGTTTCGHVWGVLPVVETAALADGFVFGLCWVPKPNRALKRRAGGFPSWSWAGWMGPVAYDALPPVGNAGCGETGVGVEVELCDGEVLELAELAGRPQLKEQPELVSPFIHLEAWVVDVRLCLGEELGSRWGRGTVWAQVELKDGTRVWLKADILTVPRGKADGGNFELLRGRNFSGILLCAFGRPEWQFVMLVEEGPTSVERVGKIDTRRFVENRDGDLKTKLVRNGDGDLVFDLNLLRVTRRKIRLG